MIIADSFISNDTHIFTIINKPCNDSTMVMKVHPDEGYAGLQRALRKSRDATDGKKNIVLSEGRYFLEESIRLGAEDSGLVLEGEGRVEILGGRKITGFTQLNDRFWAAPVDLAGGADFRMLRVNGAWANRARYPEEGFLLHQSRFDVRWLSTYEGGFERAPTMEELTTLEFSPGDIPEDFVAGNAELTIFHMWDESLVGVKRREGNQFIFSNPSGWPPGAFASHYNFEKRYVIWNTLEGMLRPGQWYLDKNAGKLVYWPLEGEDMEKAEVLAPSMENLLVLEGKEGDPVKNVEVRNLNFSLSNAPLMSGAFGAKLFDGAVSVRNAKDCSLMNLEICQVGGHCIKASGDRLRIENCQLYDAGAGAIRLVGSHSLVCNNHIHHIGRTFPSAIALYVGATDPNVPEEWEPGIHYTGCRIQHNEIHHVPYAAICAGAKKPEITGNLIYEAMQDLYDGAGIYITFCSEALVKHNFIRDIKDSPGAGTSAYYLDEKAVDCLVEENLEINVPRPSHNHISRNNIFRNNLFVIDGAGYFSMERSEGYTLEKNIIVATGGFALYDMAFCPTFRNNILFTGKEKLLTRDLDHYEVVNEYELVLKDGNLNTDPGLENFRDGVVRLSADSPAHELGFREFDVSGAGLLPADNPKN
jgi:hypothetical protein